MQQASQSADGQNVAMTDVVRFIRQLSHDLRNHLNAAELQSAYINEVAEDLELKGEVRRLRSMLSDMGASLQRLTSALVEFKLTEMPYEAAAFVDDVRQKLAANAPEQSEAIHWKVEVDGVSLNIDPQLLQQAMLELIANAFQHDRGEGHITAHAEARDGQFRFTLAEPKNTAIEVTDAWAREPFRNLKHGHYGLGLPRVRRIIEAHHGQLTARYDPASSSLVSTIELPIVARE